MIIIALNGGLGNQLFQYALGRRLAWERGLPLLFDLSSLSLKSQRSYRQYKLDHFQVQGRPASDQDLQEFHRGSQPRPVRRLASMVQRLLPYYRRAVIQERNLRFDPNILRAPSRVLLRGYWQSERYFQPVRPLLLEELHVRDAMDPINRRWLDEIRAGNSVSVHIRRGDYVENQAIREMHGVLPLSYYQQAMRAMESIVQSPHYFVFSDDAAWVHEQWTAGNNLTIVDHNNFEHDYFDFALMAACHHHVIANSSFSWWAAWLSDRPEKQVFAPRRWFQSDLDSRDVIPAGWNLL